MLTIHKKIISTPPPEPPTMIHRDFRCSFASVAGVAWEGEGEGISADRVFTYDMGLYCVMLVCGLGRTV